MMTIMWDKVDLGRAVAHLYRRFGNDGLISVFRESLEGLTKYHIGFYSVRAIE